jgi:coenzyme F420-reducing hydrogenase gamma subunit
MSTGKKVRVAFFDFTGCEGCQLAKVSMENEILGILRHVDIVNFREAMTEASWDFDVAFIEGSISSTACVERIHKIRRQAKALVAFGSCSSIAGINAIRTGQDFDDVRREVYGEHRYNFASLPALPVDQVVKVDAYIYGCPPNPADVARFLTQFLAGKVPDAVKYPVCIDCKLKENECLMQSGVPCMGPVTRAGCGAWCPSNGQFCYGCRGLVPEANKNAMKEVLDRHRLSVQEIVNKFKLYSGYYAEVK